MINRRNWLKQGAITAGGIAGLALSGSLIASPAFHSQAQNMAPSDES